MLFVHIRRVGFVNLVCVAFNINWWKVPLHSQQQNKEKSLRTPLTPRDFYNGSMNNTQKKFLETCRRSIISDLTAIEEFSGRSLEKDWRLATSN